MRRLLGLGYAISSLAAVLVVATPDAGAATGTLTVTTLGRHGTTVVSHPQAVNVATRRTFQLTSGRTRTLPTGNYVVIVDIADPSDGTDTVAARHVSVSGSATLTFRAQFARPVTARLQPSPPSWYDQNYRYSVDVANSGAGFIGFAERAHLYVLASSARDVMFKYGSTWTPQFGESGGHPHYVAGGRYQGGLPDGVSRTFHRSAMAAVHVVARSGPLSGEAEIELSRSFTLTLAAHDTLPYTFTAYVQEGSWLFDESANNDYQYGAMRKFRSGHSYSIRLNQAVDGPLGQLPYMWPGGRLNITPMFTEMFVDPVLTSAGLFQSATYTMTKGSTTVLSRTVNSSFERSFDPKLPGPGWYTLRIQATRPKDRSFPGALSPRSSLRFHFYESLAPEKQIRGYLTMFRPAGLGIRNGAARGSDTDVTLRMHRPRIGDPYVQPPDSIHRVQAWASFDHGRTWVALTVRHRPGSWQAVVHNPAADGTVSLRSKVTDAYADTSTTTVIDGYAVH
jgi:hypothetical protein